MRFADYETARVLNKIGYSGDYEYFVEEGNEYTSKDSLLIYDSMIPAPR